MKPSERIARLCHEFKHLSPDHRWSRAIVAYLDEQAAADPNWSPSATERTVTLSEGSGQGLVGVQGDGTAVIGQAPSVRQLREDLREVASGDYLFECENRLRGALDELQAWRARG